ncbi:class I adenylate-forming enzyme family protein [Actinoalloteichus caeruleus]|uniref:Acyl-CoA synthetase (AMP-forming)/AMP-acid ligase II n=1 Tax=Actinoalloteichus caeruleus DSM 43889 TaxID=1120930 RepID=A0ABT1JEA0_ACTCY|nr:class I adenylate-forming enzyme family protein [Actinoalloteichus caeruleus]MCP2330116.1 Acyl-CoA synthetase (AMP-forming)/AMP-acid ligase II [Actinoalloteichus caeruleus DSM 43889]
MTDDHAHPAPAPPGPTSPRTDHAAAGTPSTPPTLRACLDLLPAGLPLVDGRSAGEIRADADRAAQLFTEAGVRGRVTGLRVPNGAPWLVALLGLLDAGAVPLLVAADTPVPELERVLRRAGGDRWVRAVDGVGRPELETTSSAGPGGPGSTTTTPPPLLINTSGSTGTPKSVARGQRSLLVEAAHYRDRFGVRRGDVLLLPLPLPHAYALSWLACGLLVGTDIRLPAPTALRAVDSALRTEATVAALVPSVSRLLLARAGGRPAPDSAPLRVAALGAGAVDASLARDFPATYGVGLSRVYGSTETGVIATAPPHVPPLTVGVPVPGTVTRILDAGGQPVPPGVEGTLSVRMDHLDGWVDTGDVVVGDDHGVLTVLGRRSTAIRRGDRWVSPVEIEGVLREHPEVVEARVTGLRIGEAGDNAVLAEVETTGPVAVDPAELMRFARARLTPYKLPSEIRPVTSLPRASSGKVLARPRYRPAEPAALLAAASAHRVSDVVFALARSGLLDVLDGTRDALEVAADTGLPPVEVEALLTTAAELGLLLRGPAEGGPPPGSTGALGTAIDEERRRRAAPDLPTAVAPPPGADAPAVQAARRMSSLRRAVLLGTARDRGRRALARAAPPPAARVLEVSADGPHCLTTLLAHDPRASGVLVDLAAAVDVSAVPGRITVVHEFPVPTAPTRCADEDSVAAADGSRVVAGPEVRAMRFDLCVVRDAVHLPGPGSDVAALLAVLRPGGTLLVDDLFTEDLGHDGGAAVDRVASGETAWASAQDLATGLRRLGAVEVRVGGDHDGPCQVVARAPATPTGPTEGRPE